MDVRDTISGIMNLPKTEIGNISEVKRYDKSVFFYFPVTGRNTFSEFRCRNVYADRQNIKYPDFIEMHASVMPGMITI